MLITFQKDTGKLVCNWKEIRVPLSRIQLFTNHYTYISGAYSPCTHDWMFTHVTHSYTQFTTHSKPCLPYSLNHDLPFNMFIEYMVDNQAQCRFVTPLFKNWAPIHAQIHLVASDSIMVHNTRRSLTSELCTHAFK